MYSPGRPFHMHEPSEWPFDGVGMPEASTRPIVARGSSAPITPTKNALVIARKINIFALLLPLPQLQLLLPLLLLLLTPWLPRLRLAQICRPKTAGAMNKPILARPEK